MGKGNLYAYSIMRLSVPDDKILDVCNDIKEQYTTGVTACPFFLMSLVPEGNPVENKAEKLAQKWAFLVEYSFNLLWGTAGRLVNARPTNFTLE